MAPAMTSDKCLTCEHARTDINTGVGTRGPMTHGVVNFCHISFSRPKSVMNYGLYPESIP